MSFLSQVFHTETKYIEDHGLCKCAINRYKHRIINYIRVVALH